MIEQGRRRCTSVEAGDVVVGKPAHVGEMFAAFFHREAGELSANDIREAELLSDTEVGLGEHWLVGILACRSAVRDVAPLLLLLLLVGSRPILTLAQAVPILGLIVACFLVA